MASSDRQDLIRNAVAFLADPKTQSSPLEQRVQFLQAKGLTPSEIDEATRQAALNQAGPSYQPRYVPTPAYGPSGYVVPPSTIPWDWRDYFITFVVSGTVAYGAVSLFKKYLLPHLQPPSSTAYEADRDALTAQFDAVEAMLKDIREETKAVREAIDGQKEKVDKATEDVEAAVKEMREGETRTRNELNEIREEVNNVREMLPKMIDKTKESQSQSLAELQQELKSLKALLLSRGPVMPSSPSPPIPLGKPSIPAWQLAGSSSTGSSLPEKPSIPAWQLPSSSLSSTIAPAGPSGSTDTEIPTPGS